jgi:hypothetical protein
MSASKFKNLIKNRSVYEAVVVVTEEDLLAVLYYHHHSNLLLENNVAGIIARRIVRIDIP